MIAAQAKSLDVGALIDGRGLSRYQVRIVILCCLVAVLDGVDSFSIGIAAPSIAAKLGFPLSSFGSVFSAALFGATLGAFAFGTLGDRFGRKVMLVIAVGFFSVFTFLTALASSYEQLLGIRFLAGLGLGGATPCFLTLAADYAPARSRASITSLMWAGFPLGGMLGSLVNAYLIRTFDWPSLFYFGGIAPLVVAVLLMTLAPESIRFLIARGDRARRVGPIVARMFPDVSLGAGTRFVVQETKRPGVAVGQLFTQGRGIATPLMWVPFFMAFGVLVIVTLWTPALLRQAGMSGSDAAFVLAVHGLGGFFGMAIAGKLLEAFGVTVLVPAFLVGGLFTFLLGQVGTSLLLACIYDGLIGVFVGIGASGMIAFAAVAYPAMIRSTGVGWAMGMGRLGQVCAPLLAGTLLKGGWTVESLFVVVAAGPVLAAIFAPLAGWAFRAGRAAQPRPVTLGVVT